MIDIWCTSVSIEIFLCSLTATTAHLLMSLGQTLFHRYLGHRGIGGTVLIRLTPKNCRFSDDGRFPGSREAGPVFRRGIADVAMNPCTGRHTSGLQPAR